jgi:hypothetical protein
MTEERPTAEIEFQGRILHVHMPTAEQLLVWQRTVEQIQRANLNDWNAAQALKAMTRCRVIIDTVLVQEMDREWLDDEMLAGRLGLIEIAGLPAQAIEAFVEEGNREQKRAAKKVAKKAARKK